MLNSKTKFNQYRIINQQQLQPKQTINTHIYELLKKFFSCTQMQKQQIYSYLSKKYFKPLYTSLQYQKIIPHFQLKQWYSGLMLFHQGQKIQNIYFLLEGNVNLYKKNQFIMNKQAPCIIGQSLLSHNTTRYYSASICEFQTSKGFILPKKIFHLYCNSIIKQHRQFLQYLCTFTNMPQNQFNNNSNFNLSEDIQIKTALYGYNLKIQNQCNIIYKGECQMNFSKIYVNVYKVETGSNHLPYKVIKGKKDKYYPLVKLGENECFGMESLRYNENWGKKETQQNVQQQFFNNQSISQHKNKSPTKIQIPKPQLKNIKQQQSLNIKYQYIVSSQKLIYISISTQKLKLFPQKLRLKLNYIHKLHEQKLKANKYYNEQQLIIDKVNLNLQSKSKLKHTIYSPRIRQNRQTEDCKEGNGNNTFDQSIIMNQSTLKPSRMNPINSSHVKSMFNQISILNLRNTQLSAVKSRMKDKRNKTKYTQNDQLPVLNVKKSKIKNKFTLQQSNLRINADSCDITLCNKQQKQLSEDQIRNFKKKYCIGYQLRLKCDYQIENALNQMNKLQSSKEKEKKKEKKQVHNKVIDYQNIFQNLQKNLKNKQVKQFKGYFPQIKSKKNMKENQKRQIINKYNKQFQKKRKQWIYYILSKKNKV